MSDFLVGLAAITIIANLPCVALLLLLRRIAPRMHGLLRGAIAVLAGAVVVAGAMVLLGEPEAFQAGVLHAFASLLPALFIGGGVCLPATLYLARRWRHDGAAHLPAIFD
ncbi:hypothetical protein ACLIMP_08235 [Novosphingobium aerophilum]|uniref:hypothetical protein n=1 Tax=Novosphingobium aerophilum TaxID=2839843 RepID=UPI003FD0C8A0